VAGLIGIDAGKAFERGVAATAVQRVRIAACTVSLPDLDHGIGHTDVVPIKHATSDQHALASCV
jgi:hypothetical protein